jgi:hypothetical protein
MTESREPSTGDLRRRQRERTETERERVGGSATPDEERQHRRRADKAAYLEERLAQRERSERQAE